MARINTTNNGPRSGAGVVSTTGEVTSTHEGGVGFKRDAKSELFLAVVTSLNEDTFYETAEARNERIAKLVTQVATDGEWILGLVGWLRNTAGLRTVPTILASEAVKARLDAGLNGQNRAIITAAIGRVDEAADLLAYWTSRFGRSIPSCVKRGVADALEVKLTEVSYLKWRGRAAKGAVSLTDVVNLTHPKAKTPKQNALYRLVIDKSYGNMEDLSLLKVVKAREDFLKLSKEEQVRLLTSPNAERVIKEARLTHEVLSGTIGVIPGEVWERFIPHMGYQALRMNLRRMEEAGLSQASLNFINSVLADEEAVAASKTMPMEFLSAYRNAPLDFASALQRGANGSLKNVPQLRGKTLILVDHSGSMGAPMSARGTLNRSDAANVFGAALALRAENADLYSFDNSVTKVNVKTKDLLRLTEGMPGPRGGTSIRRAVESTYFGHDRVILLTDEQEGSYFGYYFSTPQRLGSFDGIVPDNVPCFTWNLAGYSPAASESGPARFSFGGLSDKGFDMIPLIERGFDTGWPWE